MVCSIGDVGPTKFVQMMSLGCSTIWGGTSQYNLNRIYRLQKRAVKIIVNYQYDNIANSMDELKILNIRGAFGKFLAWSLISVTDLQNLSCFVSF